jgi:hypothetical protein|tara:strand:- start:1637 stop:1819 length:183 start_codon:yes stop_codon:yes gene_type:complete
MNKDKEDMNGLGPVDKVVDMGELEDNSTPEPVEKKLTDEEEERLKKKLEKIRKADPFIYR